MPTMNDPEEEVIFSADSNNNDQPQSSEKVSFSDRLNYLWDTPTDNNDIHNKPQAEPETEHEETAGPGISAYVEDPDEEDDAPIHVSSVFNLEDLKDDIVLKTKQVAELCGISSQMVRNYMGIWDARINVPRSEKGDMLFGKKHAEMFQEMLLVKENGGNSRTVQGTLDYFMKPTPEMLGENGEAAPATQAFLEQMVANMTNVVDLRMRQYQESISAALEDKQMNTKELQTITEQQRLMAEKQTQTTEMMQEVLNTINALKKRDEEREKELKALRDENAELKNKINEEPPKKKLFGWF